MSRLLLVPFIIFAVAAAGCSDSDDKTKDSGVDIKVYHDMPVTDGGETACGPNIYPCGPYGTNTGDIAANMEFLGFMDPKEHCTEHKDKVMDLSKKVRISFKDWHLGDPSCPGYKKRLLWVIVSAGWCGPCQVEVLDTQKQFEAGFVQKELGILNVVFETGTNGEPITEHYIKEQWIKGLGLSFPVVMDPSFKMGAYFDASGTPFNMLVETANGKIFHRQVGGAIEMVGDKIKEFFQ